MNRSGEKAFSSVPDSNGFLSLSLTHTCIYNKLSDHNMNLKQAYVFAGLSPFMALRPPHHPPSTVAEAALSVIWKQSVRSREKGGFLG